MKTKIKELLEKYNIKIEYDILKRSYSLIYKDKKIILTKEFLETLHSCEPYETKEEQIVGYLNNTPIYKQIIIHHDGVTEKDVENIIKQIIEMLIKNNK